MRPRSPAPSIPAAPAPAPPAPPLSAPPGPTMHIRRPPAPAAAPIENQIVLCTKGSSHPQKLINFGQRQPTLILIFPALIRITLRTSPLALEENQLGNPLIGINLGRQGGGVGNFQRDLAPPFRL